MNKNHPNAGIFCLNCEEKLPFASAYCHRCGQKVIKARFHTKMVMRQMAETITNIEYGFWYSLVMLLKAPHIMLSDYLKGGTRKYTNIFRLIFLLTAINLFLTKVSGITDTQLQAAMPDGNTGVQEQVMTFIQEYMMYLFFIMIPFFALASRWLFRKKKLFFAEHMILNATWLCGTTLIGLSTYLFVPLLGDDSILLHTSFAFVLTWIYFMIANKKFYNLSWIKSFFLSFLHLVLGYVLFFIPTIIIGSLIGIILIKFNS